MQKYDHYIYIYVCVCVSICMRACVCAYIYNRIKSYELYSSRNFLYTSYRTKTHTDTHLYTKRKLIKKTEEIDK